MDHSPRVRPFRPGDEAIFRRLNEAWIELARAAGKRRLYLETNSRLSAAMSLCRRLGFVELPPGACSAFEDARVDCVMELRL